MKNLTYLITMLIALPVFGVVDDKDSDGDKIPDHLEIANFFSPSLSSLDRREYIEQRLKIAGARFVVMSPGNESTIRKLYGGMLEGETFYVEKSKECPTGVWSWGENAPSKATRYLYEYKKPLNPEKEDTDGDGLVDYLEIYFESNPHSHDSDNDGWEDNFEVKRKMDPSRPDTILANLNTTPNETNQVLLAKSEQYWTDVFKTNAIVDFAEAREHFNRQVIRTISKELSKGGEDVSSKLIADICDISIEFGNESLAGNLMNNPNIDSDTYVKLYQFNKTLPIGLQNTLLWNLTANEAVPIDFIPKILEDDYSLASMQHAALMGLSENQKTPLSVLEMMHEKLMNKDYLSGAHAVNTNYRNDVLRNLEEQRLILIYEELIRSGMHPPSTEYKTLSLKDSWGSNYKVRKFRENDSRIILKSIGPDKTLDTRDDVYIKK